MPTPKCLITDEVHPLLLEGLTAAGYVCDYLPQIRYETVCAQIAQYSGLIINSKILVNRAFLDRATHLRFVARLGSGMEIVDCEYAAARGVAVISSPEGNRNAVAEHALGMLLALANQLPQADREVRQKIWQREARRGFELMGLNIGIIGFGHTGACFAQKLSGLGMCIFTYDKYLPKGYAHEGKNVLNTPFENIIESDLATIQAQCDIISFHLPLTAETKHFADEQFIAPCKNGVILLNTSRGNVVKTEDLITALVQRKVGGAALDVFENEKVATFTATENARYEQLYGFENVILSPHIAGWTHESKQRMASILLERILAIPMETN